MAAQAILPHAVADPQSVVPGEWWVETSAGPAILEQALPHWDYSTDLVLGRTLSVDAGGIATKCRLSTEDGLAVVAVWRSTATGLRGVAATALVDPGEGGVTGPLELRAGLRGTDLGGVLVLDTQLLLAGPSRSEDPLAPRRPGNILWRDQQSVRLEGVAGRFPVEVLDLEGLGIPGASEAAWYLDWPRNRLHDSAMGATRLYINKRNGIVVDAVSQESPDDRAETIWSAIRHDLGRTLIQGALGDPEFLSDPDGYDAGSMGASIRHLMQALWPNEPPESLAARMRDFPDDWAAELQDRLRLFGAA